MSNLTKETEIHRVIDLVTEVTKRKAAEQVASRALESARRAIRAKGQFIPKGTRSRKGLRVCF